MCFCLSPALVDVDGVDFVSADGDLGQGLDHMVALQNHISLRGNTGRRKLVFSVGLFFSFFKTAAKQLGVLIFTFCLLSSLGTCRTNTPSLRELTEMPANTAQQLVAIFFSKCQSLFQIM